MPYKESGNNQTIIPANARNADVAQKAIQEIAPVQQQRYKAAFAVHGYPCVVYGRAQSGTLCSCQGSRKRMNSILGEDGKADQSILEQMLTGQQFRTTAYGAERWAVNGFQSPMYEPNTPITPPPRTKPGYGAQPDIPPDIQFEGYDSDHVTSPDAKNAFNPAFDIVAQPDTYPIGRTSDGEDEIVGDNGPVQVETLDDLMGEWDTGTMSFFDSGCPVCFGTGFVGGFNPLYGHRQVFTPDMVYLMEGSIVGTDLPWSAQGSFQFNLTLPRGASALNSLTLWNLNKRVGYRMFVDGVPTTAATIMRFCDGQPHGVQIMLDQGTQWTHLEVQFSVGLTTAYFDFPRQPRKADTNMLEQTDPFRIVISPDVPQVINPGDLISESVNGRVLIVQTVEPWNTRNRITLGQTIEVRPVQPQEYYFLLPRIYRVPTKDRTANLQYDNETGVQRKAGT